MSGIDYDLCVIGGGINGAGIARDAAGRGLKVLLLEAQDLGGATSSASTKLIHGGLRYLEYYEFKMVRDALKERELLLSLAPHVIWPMEFILPHTPEQRPQWMIKLGLFLYDHLAKRNKLPASSSLDLHDDMRGKGLKETYKTGFSYADCWADDSRLVALNAMSAAQKGATILTRHKCTGLQHCDEYWRVTYQGEGKNSADVTIKAGMVINAAGPWVSSLIDDCDVGQGENSLPNIRLVKGSHIIVKRRHKGEHAFILQQSDNRIIFAIPYEKDFTLIGTTEEAFDGDARDARISDDEMEYLVNAYNESFKKPLKKKDVLWTYSGVRPLYDDGEASATSATRDYRLHMHLQYAAPMLSVFGGKLTTYRKLAEDAVDRIVSASGRTHKAWTGRYDIANCLPGGNIPDVDFDAFLAQQGQRYKWLPKALLYRYARSYGTNMDVFLQGTGSLKDLGKDFGGGDAVHIYEAEILYLLRYEFVKSSEDVLWRRTKLGLVVDDKVAPKIDIYIRKYFKDKA